MIASDRMFRRSAGKTHQIADEPPPDDAEEQAPDDDGSASPPSLAQRLDVTGTQVCASTLASVSAAAVASVFGVTGTIVGAAVMSVIATTGSALYSHGIRRTGAKLQETPVAELTRRLGPWPGAGADPTGAPSRTAAPVAVTGPASPTPAPGWREWLSRRRWGVALGVGIVFAATLGVVTLVELAGQRSLADIAGDSSGQTSIGSFLVGSDDGQTPRGASTTVAPGATDDPAATDDPGSTVDGSTDDPSGTVDPDDPGGSPTTEPSTPTTADEGSPPATDGESSSPGALDAG
jgi:hypothetical protein